MATALILLSHPSNDSLNAATARAVADRLQSAGADVHTIDLYEIDFDPVLRGEEMQRRFSFDGIIQEHVRLVIASDLLVFVHPDWWGGMPAILHGWIERVFRPGIAYEFTGPEFGEKSRVPLLTGKQAVVAVTSDQACPEAGHAVERVWREHILSFCGITCHSCFILDDVRHTTYRARRRWITRVGDAAEEALSGAEDPRAGTDARSTH